MLKHYVVQVSEEDGSHLVYFFPCLAEDVDHAIEQSRDMYSEDEYDIDKVYVEV